MFGAKRKGVGGMFARLASGAPNMVVEADPRWQEWAQSRGFQYELDGSDLVGVYIDSPEGRGVEQYHGVVRGEWGDRPFVFFHRTTWARTGRESGPGRSSGYALQLPGRLRADLRAMPPDQAFKAAGGELPRSGTYEWHGADELLWTGAHAHPEQLEGYLQSVTLQLAFAPPELWEH